MDTGGAVYPKQDCPHIWMKGSLDLNKINHYLQSAQTTLFQTGCSQSGCCSSTTENWLCLSCGNVQCSRYINGHSEEHWIQSLMSVTNELCCSHCLVLSLSDLNIWCYCCYQYIKHELFIPLLVKAEALKFTMPEKSELLTSIRSSFPVGVVFVPRELSEKHAHHSGCFERPARLEAIHTVLENKNLLSKLYSIEPVCASVDTLQLVHSTEYISRVRRTAEPEPTGAVARAEFAAQRDVYATSSTYELACYAAGSTVALTERLCRGDSIKRGFAVVRPPGHHAERNSAGGFCYFNNVALAVQTAISGFGMSRVMIVDFDIHHGNGNQSVFYSSSQVLHVSLHKQFHRVGERVGERAEGHESGGLAFLGDRDGLGFNVNIPLDGYSDLDGPGLGDSDYLAVFEEVVLPLAREFRPELIVIPAGFDAGVYMCFINTLVFKMITVIKLACYILYVIYYNIFVIGEHDRNLAVGGYSVSYAGFAEMTRRLMGAVPDGRTLAVLEGGYDCRGLAESVAAVLEAMLEFADEDSSLSSTATDSPAAFSPKVYHDDLSSSFASLSTAELFSSPSSSSSSTSLLEQNTSESTPTATLQARNIVDDFGTDKKKAGPGLGLLSTLSPVHPDTLATIREVKTVLAPYWTCFQKL